VATRLRQTDEWLEGVTRLTAPVRMQNCGIDPGDPAPTAHEPIAAEKCAFERLKDPQEPNVRRNRLVAKLQLDDRNLRSIVAAAIS
jgi:hypothetical protein